VLATRRGGGRGGLGGQPGISRPSYEIGKLSTARAVLLFPSRVTYFFRVLWRNTVAIMLNRLELTLDVYPNMKVVVVKNLQYDSDRALLYPGLSAMPSCNHQHDAHSLDNAKTADLGSL
jgi:hypothetical protein